MLLAADYSQIELRVLAHLSRDVKLIEVLRQAGASGDAFALIAKTWLRHSHHPGAAYSFHCAGLSTGVAVTEVRCCAVPCCALLCCAVCCCATLNNSRA